MAKKSNQKDARLQNLQDEYVTLKVSQQSFQRSIQAFILKILAQPKEIWESLIPLYRQIGKDLFDAEISASNYDLAAFIKAVEQYNAFKSAIVPVKKAVEPEEYDFEERFVEFCEKYGSLLKHLKGYYIFHLNSKITTELNVIFLCDQEYASHPQFIAWGSKPENSSIKIMQIEEFATLLTKEVSVISKSYLCLLFLTPKYTSGRENIKSIQEIISKFDRCVSISLRNIDVTSASDYEYRNIDQTVYDEMESYFTKVFNNKALSFHEEEIIKHAFPISGDSNSILEYRILKAGFSGSKVIEVQPITRYFEDKTNRYVLKFAKKVRDKSSKIYEERKRFGTYIEQANEVSAYTCEYFQTTMYDAIKYKYASSDGKKDSFSFSFILDTYIKHGNGQTYKPLDTIEQLFKCAPFQYWKSTKKESTKQVQQFFEIYLESENKIFDSILEIRNTNESALISDKLIMNYKEIKKYTLKGNLKVCHGDLHSENFFKDESGVFLIDFGYTGEHPSCIDHATIEASIKFKHMPLYMSDAELEEFENTLFDPLTFAPGFNGSKIARPVANELLNMIVKVRENADQFIFDDERKLDYLICLFVITFRQIQYKDLSQRYALKSAELLSDKIIELISE